MPSYSPAQENRLQEIIKENGPKPSHRSAADERFIAEKYLALEEATAEYNAWKAAGKPQEALKDKKSLLQSLKDLISKS